KRSGGGLKVGSAFSKSEQFLRYDDENYEQEEEDMGSRASRKNKPKARSEPALSFFKGTSRIPSEVGSSARGNAGRKVKEENFIKKESKKLGMVFGSENEDDCSQTVIAKSPFPPRAESLLSKTRSQGPRHSKHSRSILEARDCGSRFA